jgi:hypothetical protein
VKSLLTQIVQGNELNQKYLSPRENMLKTWNNWMRLRRKKRPELKRQNGE